MNSAHSPRVSNRLLAATLAAAFALAGCTGTGVDAQTNQQYQAGIGTNVRFGQVQLYNALAVDNGDGTATLSAVILNTTDQPVRLEGARATGDDATTPIKVETAPAIIGPDEPFNTGPAATVIFTGDALVPGYYFDLTLTFDPAGEVTLKVPVVERTEMYERVAQTPGGAE